MPKGSPRNEPSLELWEYREVVTNREDPPAEPESNFPLGFYEHFLSEIRRRGIVTVTYDDLFATSHDFDHEKHFPHEFKN